MTAGISMAGTSEDFTRSVAAGIDDGQLLTVV